MSIFNREYTWIMKDVSFYDIEEEIEILSPEFNLNNTKFIIQLHFKKSDSSQYVNLSLLETLKSREELTLDMEMEISNSVNEIIYVTEKKKVMFGTEEIIPCSPILPLIEEQIKKIKNSLEDILILKFRVVATSKCAAVEFPLNSSCTVQTRECLDELSFIRTVDYFDEQICKNLTFLVDERKKLNVSIETHHEDIIFKITESVFYPQIFKCEITLLNDVGVNKNSCFDYIKFSKTSEIWHFPNFLKRSFLKKEFDILIFKFIFTFSTGETLHELVDETKLKYLSSSLKTSKNESENALTDDLREMLFRKDLSDVSFCVDSEVISAHKFILAARSPVFSAMFQHEMIESQTGVIDITDMDIQTLKLLLEYMYTGDLSEYNWKIMLELLLAAVKYQISSLSSKCSQFLKLCLNPDSICDVISVADMVGEQVLKNAAIKYIKDNAFNVLSSPKWCMFTEKNSKLCSEIFIMFSDDLKTKHIDK